MRVLALEGDKLVYMAVPRLSAEQPFLALDPARLSVPARRAASIKGASTHGRPVGLDEMLAVAFLVGGSVAVNRDCARVGKGGGVSDLEFALARQAGSIDHHTDLATTVHSVQVLDEELPETEHDFRVDLVVTPESVHRAFPAAVRPPGLRGPPGILWPHLNADKIATMPILVALRAATVGFEG
ncbi:MAG: hypothetical protein NVSMB32_12010 [Actinomycetota bacterium]